MAKYGSKAKDEAVEEALDKLNKGELTGAGGAPVKGRDAAVAIGKSEGAKAERDADKKD